jgi:hypothetical protein
MTPAGVKGVLPGTVTRPVYPRRVKNFAYKFCRRMAKSCVGGTIGPETCWLLTVIVMTEDAKRYAGPVQFFAANLADQCGFSVSTLERARRKAVQAGWLHYGPGAKRRMASYWVLLPPDAEGQEDRRFCGLGMNVRVFWTDSQLSVAVLGPTPLLWPLPRSNNQMGHHPWPPTAAHTSAAGRSC